jgi:hypothetical protein
MRVIIAAAISLFPSLVFAAPRFDKTPAPPRVFDGIRAGMLADDAQLASWEADASYKDAAARKRLVKDAGDGAKYYVLLSGAVISRIGVEAPKQILVPRLEKLWGAPTQATNIASEAIASWTSKTWRVDLSCREALCRMAFHQPLTAAFFGAAPEPPGVLASLRPGMSRDDVAKLSPRHLTEDVPAGPEDVRVTVDLAKSGHVRSVLVGGLPPNARALLEKAWGAGTVWFNPDRGWRAELDDNLHTLQLTGYIPTTKILGGGPGIALFAKPLLGATREQIVAAYPMARADGKRLVIELPPSEGGVGRVVLVFDPTKLRVKRMTIELPYDTDARRAELLKLMSVKWGTPTAKSAVLVFPTDTVQIEVSDGAKRLDVSIVLP